MIGLALLGLASAGGALYWWLHRAPSNLDAAGAAMADLAARVAIKGPRGEYVLKPDTADTLTRLLSTLAFSYPSALDPTMVKLTKNLSDKPLTADTSALGWATRMNASRTILAPLYMADPKNVQDKFLRAVDPGKESEFAGPGGMYAVLLYVGALAKAQKPPGSPPNSVPGEIPVPQTEAQALASELGSSSAVLGPLLDLLQNGADGASMREVSTRLGNDGFIAAASIVQKRADALLAGMPAPVPVSPPAPPAPSPAPPAPQAPQILSVPPTPFHVNSPSGADVYAGPSLTSGKVMTIGNGTSVTVVAQTGDNVWGQIAMPVKGWLQSGTVLMDGPMGSAPPPTGAPTLSVSVPGTTLSTAQLDDAMDAALPPDAAPSATMKTARGTLNVRSEPSTQGGSATIRGSIQPGTQVTVAESVDGGWVHVLSPIDGWVCNTCSAAPGGPWLA